MKIDDFFTELKRRNVYKVAVAYAIVAWLLLQALSILLPAFDAPSWVLRVFIAAIAAGFPLALVFAWAFEITPEGLKRTEGVAPQQSIARSTGRKLNRIIIAVLALVIGLLVFDRFRPRGRNITQSGEKSIAVLPFDNYSEDKQDAFFADGIQDDILTSLAKVRELKVISRTSVAGYRGGGTRNLRDIAAALGVSNVLEGSVRRVKGRVLVNVQLIDALTDRHLWAERYDRTMEDVISLQGELASEIAAALKATLTPEERSRVENKPTEDAEAYAWYLRGLKAESRPDIALEYYREAEDCYERAVAVDPGFALARAKLGHINAQIYHEFEPTEARAQRAKTEAEEALRLNPKLGDGHLALADWYYWVAFDYESALRELAMAKEFLPNDSTIPLATAAIRRRQGRWQESDAQFQRALQLDPRNAGIAQEYAYSKFMLRDWAGATAAAEHVLEIDPRAQIGVTNRAWAEHFRTGDPASAEAVFKKLATGEDVDGTFTLTRFQIALLRRDFVAAERALAASPREVFPMPSMTPLPRSFLQACLALARGDQVAAKPFLETTAAVFEKAANANSTDASPHAMLGWTYAHLGRKDEALREGRRALELRPESKDAIIGPHLSALLTLIYVRTGEHELALNEIERLLVTPAAPGLVDSWFASVTLADLRNSWMWDPLRNNPRFQKILSGPEPQTIYR
jgi:TolB-like protein/cytochrome c-type biogenesis protein CcmH/NrfG